MKTILLIEDDLKILNNNSEMLSKRNYRVLTAENLARAREHLANETPDAIILDIMLPDGNGLDLLRELRGAGSKIPVIMLTAWSKPSDVERGLTLGANDYLSKPFTYGVLLARVETMFRNVEQIPDTIEYESLTLKPKSTEIFFGSQKFKLSAIEFFTLQLLIENEGKDLAPEYIYEQVWGANMINDTDAVRSTIKRLRGKLKGSGCEIVSGYQKGYRFQWKSPS